MKYSIGAVRVCFYIKEQNFSGFHKSGLQHPRLIVITGSEGGQNRPPPDKPLGHVNYFELEAIKILGAQEKLSPLPLNIYNWGLALNKSYYQKQVFMTYP